jgi:uncharacterized membrane protein
MHIEKKVVIHRPPAEVFSWVSDPARLPEWISNLMEVKIRPPVAGLGTTYCDVTKFEGRLITQEYQVIEYEPAGNLTLKSISGTIPSLLCFTFEALPDRTTALTLCVDRQVERLFSQAGTLLLYTRLSERQLHYDLETLKILLENE